MSGFYNDFVTGATTTFAGKGKNFKDYTHASKTFTTNAFGNAPKYKWLFHVYFDINKQYVTNNPTVVFPDTTNYGVLVKNIQLPKFQTKLEELNQYNRKRYVQTKINYDPVQITFHDDNLNQIKNMWIAYYAYNYYDPSNPAGSNTGYRTNPGRAAGILNHKNTYNPDISADQTWGYSGEITTPGWSSPIGLQKAPFFKSIRIYGFNQHNFSGYELINPVIESFAHDQYNYYETSSIMENSMTIRYESVNYFQGALNGEDPESSVDGFGNPAIYDRELSPISLPGSNKTILGQNGLVDAAGGIYSDLAKGNINAALQTAVRTANTFNNPQALLATAATELVQGAKSITSSPDQVRSVFNFPSFGSGSGAGSQETRSTNQTAGLTDPPSVTQADGTDVPL
jgi:hypothetical protein